MGRFNEQTFLNWTKPASDTEETKLANAERMVKDTINSNDTLNSLSIDIFGQGSYANDTNVRLNSDIDINICYTTGFYYDFPVNKLKEDFDFIYPIAYNFDAFKNDVERALISAFDRSQVQRNNKCITIVENTYRVKTDVVPTWRYRRYSDNKTYVEGVYLKTDAGISVQSYPKQHIANSKGKNGSTSKRFKRLTRIFRKLRYKMLEDGLQVSANVTSFLLECLVWNVPNQIFNNFLTWTDRLRESVIYLYNETKEESTCKNWGEVSELLYLFYQGRKWSRENVNNYLVQMWKYLEF